MACYHMLKETNVHTHFEGIKSLEKRKRKPVTLLLKGKDLGG